MLKVTDNNVKVKLSDNNNVSIFIKPGLNHLLGKQLRKNIKRCMDASLLKRHEYCQKHCSD